MWQIIAGLLDSNNKLVQGRKDATRQRQLDTQERIANNRAAADQIKNQTTSANYGKFDMDNLIGGVFGNKKNQAAGTNWAQIENRGI